AGAGHPAAEAAHSAADQDEQRVDRREHGEGRGEARSEEDQGDEGEEGLRRPTAQAPHPGPGYGHPVTGSGRRLLGLAHLVLVPSLMGRPRTERRDVRGARGSRRPAEVTVRSPRRPLYCASRYYRRIWEVATGTGVTTVPRRGARAAMCEDRAVRPRARPAHAAVRDGSQ